MQLIMAKFFNQYSILLLIFCKLKGFKFLLLTVVIAIAFSNHFIYGIVRQTLSSVQVDSFQPIGVAEFAKQNVLLSNWKKIEAKRSNIQEYYSTAELKNDELTFEECQNMEGCQDSFMRALLGSMSEKFTSLITYPEIGQNLELLCQARLGNELQCVVLGSLLLMAQIDSRLHRFGALKMFQAIIDVDRSQDFDFTATKATLCDKDLDFRTVMPYTLTIQIILLQSGLCFYLLLSTVQCIWQLKYRQFLQMLFRRGFSVQTYWLALWTVTTAELLIVSCALVVSYHTQCPGYYSAGRLGAVFVTATVQMACLTSGILLLTIAIRECLQIGLAATMLVMLCVLIAVLLRTAASLLKGKLKAIRNLAMMLPPGNMAEQLQEVLLNQESGGSTSHTGGANAITYCTLACILLVTLYFDYVLPHGNGFHMPVFYLFMTGFWIQIQNAEASKNHQETSTASRIEIETEFQVPVIQIRKLVKQCYSSCHPTGWSAVTIESVTMYQNCISAVVGHSKSGKTAIAHLLSALESPNSGFISIDSCDVSSPESRIHKNAMIGICQQRNRLCHELSVSDTLKLLLASCNQTDWEVEVQTVLETLQLADKMPVTVGSLSSSNRRLLCVALAVLGSPKVVVLDEPTRGLDPSRRRNVWKILQKFQMNRCTVICTQQMEEAEFLADRVYFAANGTIVCGGSALFLQTLSNCKYQFQVELKVERLVKVLMHELRAKFKNIDFSDVYRRSFQLRVSSVDIKLLSSVVAELERRSDHFQYVELTYSSLTDIFVQIQNCSTSDIAAIFGAHGDKEVSDRTDYSIGNLSTKKCTNSERDSAAASNTPFVWPFVDCFAALLFVKLIRNSYKLIWRLATAAVLLVILAALTVLERMAKNGELPVHQLIGNSSLARLGPAFCLTDDDAFNSASGAFHGDRQLGGCFGPSLSAKGQYSLNGTHTKSKFSMQSFQDYYRSNPDIIKELMSHCKRASGCTVPYRIAYVSNTCTCPVEYNQLRDVYAGSIIDYRHYSSHLVAKSTFETFRHIFKYFASNSTNGSADSNLQLKVVYDFTTMTIPTLGAFVQMLIITAAPTIFINGIDADEKLIRTLAGMGLRKNQYLVAMLLHNWIQASVLYVVSVVILVSIIPSGYLSWHYLAGVVLPTLFLGISSNQLLIYMLFRLFHRSIAQVAASHCLLCFVLAMSMLAAQLSSRVGLVLIFSVPQFASMAPTFYGSKWIFYALSYYKCKSVSEVPNGMKFYFDQIHLKYSLIAMLMHCILLCALLAALERTSIPNCTHSCSANVNGDQSQSAPDNDKLLQVRSLQASYASSPSKALSDVTFSAAAGDIIGLAGPNDSGKSAALTAIAGAPDGMQCSGETFLRHPGEGWMTCRSACVAGYVGYWPQRGLLSPHITVLEHLALLARCRYPDRTRSELATHIHRLLRQTGLHSLLHARIADLDQDRVGLLRLASAMLGNPTLLLLDDVTRGDGSDLQSRHAVRSAVRSWLAERPDCRAVVLTTRSINEAEDLSSQIGVINNGQLVRLDSTENFRRLLESHYIIDIKIDPAGHSTDSQHDLKTRIIRATLQKFANAKIIDSLPNRVLFVALIDNLVIGAIKWLCQLSKSMSISFFTIRPITLDNVFESFMKIDANMQHQQPKASAILTEWLGAGSSAASKVT